MSPGTRRAERAARRGSMQSSSHDNQETAKITMTPKTPCMATKRWQPPKRASEPDATSKITMTPKTPSGVKKWQRRVSDADVASVPTLFQAAVAASPRTSGTGSVRSTRRSLDTPKKRISESSCTGLPPAFQSISSPNGSGGSVRTTRRSIDRDSQRERRRSRSTSVSGMRDRKERIRSSRAPSTKALDNNEDKKDDLENGISDLNFATISPKPSKPQNNSSRDDDKENELENGTSNLNYCTSPQASKSHKGHNETKEDENDLENGISDLNFMPLDGEEKEAASPVKSTRSERTSRRSIDRDGARERRRSRSTSVSGMRERKERLRASYEQTKRNQSSGSNENGDSAPPTPRRLSTWEKREALKRQSWDQRKKIASSMNAAMGDNEMEIPLPPAFRQFAKRK